MDERMRLIVTLVPLGLALVGLFFAVTGVRRLVRERAFAAGAAQAAGTVIGFRTRVAGRSSGYGNFSGVLDFPIVRYAPLGGREIEFESPTGSSPGVHREGQVVTVRYDPADPRRRRSSPGACDMPCRSASSASAVSSSSSAVSSGSVRGSCAHAAVNAGAAGGACRVRIAHQGERKARWMTGRE